MSQSCPPPSKAAACTLRCPRDQISGSAPLLPTKGLSSGHGPVRPDAEDLPHVAVEPLRLRAHGRVGALAQRDVEHLVRSEHEARPEMLVAVVRRQRPEDDLHLLELAAIGREHAPGDAGRVAAFARLGEAPEDRAVAVERGAERHVEEPALPARRPPRAGRRSACPPRPRQTRCACVRASPSPGGLRPGSGSTAQGFSSPVATTVTSNATSEVMPQARVCSRNAGFWSGALGWRVSSGVQGAELSVCAGELDSARAVESPERGPQAMVVVVMASSAAAVIGSGCICPFGRRAPRSVRSLVRLCRCRQR